MNRRKGEEGYSLMETLFVLSIFLVMVTIIPIYLVKIHEHFETEFLLRKIKTDIYQAQMYSLTKERIVLASFSPSEKQYVFRDPYEGNITKWTTSEHVNIIYGRMNNFRFKSNGNIDPFGTLYIKIFQRNYAFTFHIGRGRFEVKMP